MKRAGDCALASLLLLVSLPVWLLILLLIVALMPGPIFFLHPRVGRNGVLFRLVKFRTMRVSRTEGLNLTIAGDQRITVLGKVLRRLKLDELPQLLNVVRGQMTFVGPRPEVPEFVARYTPEQRAILQYTPGLTDPASLKYRHEERELARFPDPIRAYLEQILPDKLKLSLDYQARRNFRSDLGIIIRTIAALFTR